MTKHCPHTQILNSEIFFPSSVLPPFESLASSSPSSDSIILSWSAVSDAVQYTISMYKLGSSSSMKYNTTDTNLTVSGLDAGSLYMIRGFPWDVEGREGDDSLYINQTTRKKLLRQWENVLFCFLE